MGRTTGVGDRQKCEYISKRVPVAGLYQEFAWITTFV